jgi:FlaA1/EpsC-like NDP-sugar epimerase
MHTRITERILELSRLNKQLIVLAADTFICLFTVAVAYLLRLDRWIFPVGNQWFSYIAAVLISLPIFLKFGFYRAIFRYAGWGALVAMVRACSVYAIVYATIFTVISVYGVPRSVGIIQPVLLILAIGTSRAVARYWFGGGYQALGNLGARKRVLIYGAGSAGRQLAAGLANSDEMMVIGFVDDDATLHGSVLNGKMIYSPDGLEKLLPNLRIADLLLALPSASRTRRNEIIALARETHTSIRTLPGLADLAHGRVTVNDLRELDIEDLLGRDAVAPNQLLLSKNIAGKKVLVTGAGGSIGSELCRQALKLRPEFLLLIEQSEINLYNIHNELENLLRLSGVTDTRIVPLLGSVQNELRMDSIFSTWKPDTIYHAAAYKHVPLVEHNPAEGVRNNVFGTLNVAKLAKKNKVRDFVLISTDKAVRPTNIMGASKRVAELILQSMATEPGNTRFSMVRFGNVLGSSGSVVPLFRQQIKAGGPITITHAGITRYFMTIPEAAQLVIQASAMAHGGEVYVLDMGQPVKILDLAERMIELSGLQLQNDENPDGDIKIDVVGLRPGEKLYEELLIGDNPKATNHPKIMMARDDFHAPAILKIKLKELTASLVDENVNTIRATLNDLVPEFSSKETVDWVHLEEMRNQ